MDSEHITESQPLAPPPGTAQPIPAVPTNHIAATWVSLKQWAAQNNIGPVQRISAGDQPTFALRAPRGLFIVRANDQVAYWNSIELHLGFAPRLITNQLFIQGLDISKNIEPLLHPLALPANTNRVIVIDPGHGGANFGTTNILGGSHEKQFTLDWAKRLAPILATNGWKVYLTRTNDTDIPLGDRVSFADACKADVFISLHFNAPASANDHEEAGIETFCVTPNGMPSTLKREFEDNPALVYPNNRFDAENLRYAMQVQRSILKVTAAHDRGVWRARFMGVLRGQNRPAILVEGGFLSNPREARHIQDPAYRQKLAEAVALALIEKPVPHAAPPSEQAATNSPAAAVETAQKTKPADH
jgi:N-acetylmuramoyl-L-alanine amidase